LKYSRIKGSGWRDPLIEFKGSYYKKSGKKPQSVLVQFDGVLLHVWNLSNPFYRLLTSDVFRLPASISSGKRTIKLPNGDKIETDNLDAVTAMRSNRRSVIDHIESAAFPGKYTILLPVIAVILLLGVCASALF
jgi:hypothetical protein